MNGLLSSPRPTGRLYQQDYTPRPVGQNPVYRFGNFMAEGARKNLEAYNEALSGYTAAGKPVPGILRALQLMPGGPGMVASKALGGVGPGMLGMNVWHGGPRKWAPEPGFPQGRPRMDKIGTGEGHQAYGHGFYAAENKAVGKDYGDRLFGNKYPASKIEISEAANAFQDANIAWLTAITKGKGKDVIARLKDRVDKQIENLAAVKKQHGPQLYKLDLPDEDVAKYLDWDAPWEQQAPSVKEAYRQVYEEVTGGPLPSMEGWNPYQLLEAKVGSDVAASEALRKAGIPGLKYFDAGSRPDLKGTRNYVTWDQDVLDRAARQGVELGAKSGAPGKAVVAAEQGLRDKAKSANMPAGSGGRSPLPGGVPGNGVPQPLPTYPPTVPPRWVSTDVGLSKIKRGTKDDKQFMHDQAVDAYGPAGMPARPAVYPKDPDTGVVTAPGSQQAYPASTVYAQKRNSPEAEAVKKQVNAAQRDIDAGNYTPMFDVSKRADVDVKKYDLGASTQDTAWAQRPATRADHRALAKNKDGVKRLEAAFKEGKTIQNSSNWYYMRQLEQAFIKKLGAKKGREAFREKFARSMAATTGGASPKENFRTAMYGNFIRESGLPYPTAAHQMPFPAGGQFVTGNLKTHKGFSEAGEITSAHPKRHNFEVNFLGDEASATVDKQMSQLFNPTLVEPAGASYGAYEEVLIALAKKHGVSPREFQEVAWAGAKKGREGAKYPGSKPMIQEVNEAIQRTSRVTGQTPKEVLEQGIIGSKTPIYAKSGAEGKAVVAAEQAGAGSGQDRDRNLDPTIQRNRTNLDAGSEAAFQQWYGDYSNRNRLNRNPDDPRHQYDYRGWWQGIQSDPERYTPQVSPHDGFEHGPSEFKDSDHPTMWKEHFLQATGQDPDDLGIPNEAAGRAYIEQNAPPNMTPVTDPGILMQLDGRTPITDEGLLQRLNAVEPQNFRTPKGFEFSHMDGKRAVILDVDGKRHVAQ